MLTTRRLSLTRETLTALTDDELTAVQAGALSGDCTKAVTRILTWLTCDVTCMTEA